MSFRLFHVSFSVMLAVMHALSVGFVDSDNLHVRVLYAREMIIDEQWCDIGICSTYWRYYVNFRNGASVRLADGRLYALPSGHVHIIPAWVRIDLVNVVPIEHLWAHFDIVGLPGTLVRDLFHEPCSLALDSALSTSADAMRQALGHVDAANRPDALFSTKAAIHISLARLFSQLPTASSARMASVMRADSPLAPALRFIDDNLARSVRVSALARLCGYAEDHFTRIFRREVGQTPGQYVLERRVAIAAQRLVLSQASIDQIAEDCGFPDRFYFTRMFTRRMGVPPAAYRNAQPSSLGSPRRPRT